MPTSKRPWEAEDVSKADTDMFNLFVANMLDWNSAEH